MLVKYDFLPQLIKRSKNEKPKLRFPNSPHSSKACRQDYCAISRRVAEIAIYDKNLILVSPRKPAVFFFTLNLVTTFSFLAKPDVDRCFFFFNKELTYDKYGTTQNYINATAKSAYRFSILF